MKSDNNSIDNLFKDGLCDYEAEPSESSWSKISQSLEAQETSAAKPKSGLSKGYIYTFSAALVAVVTTVVLLYNSEEKPKTNATIDSTTTLKVQEKLAIPIAESQTEIVQIVQIAPIETKSITEKTTTRKKEIFLPDGSKVNLNRNSEISYKSDFSSNKEVKVKGEVYFEVRKKDDHPLIIWYGNTKIEVAEASFFVKTNTASEDEVYVVSNQLILSNKRSTNSSEILKTGFKGLVKQNASIELSRIVNLNFDAWVTEKIVFQNTKIQDVILTLEEYFAVPISVKNATIYQCRFTGTFEKTDLVEILDVLSVTFNLSYNQKEGNYVLDGVGCN